MHIAKIYFIIGKSARPRALNINKNVFSTR